MSAFTNDANGVPLLNDTPEGEAGVALELRATLLSAAIAALAGKADSSHSHDAGDITTGTFVAARLGSEIASNAKLLRGDLTWASGPVGDFDIFGGGAHLFRKDSDTTANREVGSIEPGWVDDDDTDATRRGCIDYFAWDTAKRFTHRSVAAGAVGHLVIACDDAVGPDPSLQPNSSICFCGQGDGNLYFTRKDSAGVSKLFQITATEVP